jgi:hypothetical protein
MASESLASVAGPSGVGALCVLGIFLFVDGRSPQFYPTVEVYAKSTTWGVVAAVPLLAITYVMGLFLNSLGVHLVQALSGISSTTETIDLSRTAFLALDKSAAMTTYVQLMQDRAVLAGSSIAFLVLAVGAISEVANLEHIRSSVIALAILAIGLVGVLVFVAVMKTKEAHTLADAVVKYKPAEVSTSKS